MRGQLLPCQQLPQILRLYGRTSSSLLSWLPFCHGIKDLLQTVAYPSLRLPNYWDQDEVSAEVEALWHGFDGEIHTATGDTDNSLNSPAGLAAWVIYWVVSRNWSKDACEKPLERLRNPSSLEERRLQASIMSAPDLFYTQDSHKRLFRSSVIYINQIIWHMFFCTAWSPCSIVWTLDAGRKPWLLKKAWRISFLQYPPRANLIFRCTCHNPCSLFRVSSGMVGFNIPEYCGIAGPTIVVLAITSTCKPLTFFCHHFFDKHCCLRLMLRLFLVSSWCCLYSWFKISRQQEICRSQPSMLW